MSARTITAIPTVYRGVRFRSRLEARWAAFFDIVGWGWVYEPSDYKGWTPDFALLGAKKSILVEVKPINWGADYDGMIEEVAGRSDLLKTRGIDCAGQEILILGAYPVLYPCSGSWLEPVLGIFVNESWGAYEHGLDNALFWRGDCGDFDFAAATGSYHYRMSGRHDGDHHLLSADAAHIESAWAQAGNAVQWMPRKKQRAPHA